MNDPIVDEVWRVRDAHAIFRDIKEQEKKSGLKFVLCGRTEPPKELQPTGAAISVSPDSK